MLFHIKHSKLFSVNGVPQKVWGSPRSGGSGRPNSVLFEVKASIAGNGAAI